MHSQADSPILVRVLRFFEEISKIPRRSFLSAPIADYLCRFAHERGLFCYRDEADNVVIKKDGSADCKSTRTLILQAHTDMVFVASDPDADIDENQGLTLVLEGDTLRADGTSLGGDDGIGMAYILAILDDDKMTHPPLEAVFTSNEEVGLLGATALDTSVLSGDMLINLDSDEEGIFTAGCAGGSTAVLSIPVKREKERECITLSLFGLPGGHSGADIHKGIANAIRLLLSLLEEIGKQTPIEIAEITGGEASNAIPSFACADFYCEKKSEEIEKICQRFLSNQKENVGDARLCIKKERRRLCMREKSSLDLIHAILSLPHGILAMDAHLSNLPETSLNLGKIETHEEEWMLCYALRSSVDEKCRALEKKLAECAEAFGATAQIDGIYPAWEYREHSPLRDACLSVFRKRYNFEPTVSIIHAGLECGILAQKLPGLDCISFGPNNRNIHTAQEALSLSSSAAVFAYLTELLSALAH